MSETPAVTAPPTSSATVTPGNPAAVTPSADPATGFPADTHVSEMTIDQQAAYWRHQAKKHQGRAEARADYDEIKAKAAKLEKLERQAMSEHDRVVAETREAALAEGRAQAAAEVNGKYARAMLEMALTSRGRTAEQVETVLKHTNLETYVTNGEPDTDAIAAYADTIAGPIGTPPPRPDHGQGPRGPQSKQTGLAAGEAMYATRHGKPPPQQ